ncbi:hypothetical protein ECG_00739 [Echinococcus granulosus]|nr:hypothetical protein ECG_00739 [Echinococcus granulosus]
MCKFVGESAGVSMGRLRGRSARRIFNDGLGLGSTFICAVVAVTYYFERYRGVASGIASAGTGVGYIVVPLALNSLMTRFDTPIGWRHAVLVDSFILTGTTFVNGLIIRPLEIEAATLNEILDMENMPTYPINHIGKTFRSGLETIRGSEVLGFTSQPKNSSHPLQEQLAEIFASVPTIPGSQLDGSQHTKHSGLWDRIVAQEVDAARRILAEKLRSCALSNDQRDGDILKSAPDGLSHFRLEPSYLHSKVPFFTKTVVVKPLDRPDSLFPSSLHILPSLDRGIANRRMDVNTHL